MVGFGSSLRMSRRRGWEEAYLDYASLRLLLTQIEAVYEEEDWKRGDSNHHLNYEEGMEKLDDGIILEEGNDDTNAGRDDENDWEDFSTTNYFSGVLGSAWRKTKLALLGRNRDGDRRRRKRKLKKSKRSNKPRSYVGFNGLENNDYWALTGSNSSDYGYQRRSQRTRERDNITHKNDNSKESNQYRALDKGGWRSPGVTDYRDELFLESDDDLAFGYKTDEDDDDDWEDEDSEDDNDNNRDQYYGYGDSYYNDYTNLDGCEHFSNRGNRAAGGQNLGVYYEERNHDVQFNEEPMYPQEQLDHQSYFHNCNSPLRDKHNDGIYFNMPHGTFDTPQHMDDDNHRLLSDSPGILEASYDTFKDSHAHDGTGFNHDCSPSDRGWGILDFIPNFFSKKGLSNRLESKSLQRKQIPPDTSSHNMPVTDGAQDSLISLYPNKSSSRNNASISNSPNHYTHFSDSFQSISDSPLPTAPSFSDGEATHNRPLKFRSEPRLSPLFERSECTSVSCPSEMDSMLATPSNSTLNEDAERNLTTLDYKTPLTKKNRPKTTHPVPASAIGTAMPMTPITPLSPVAEQGMDEFNRTIEGFFLNSNEFDNDFAGAKNLRSCGASNGFGVTLNMDPRSVLAGENAAPLTPTSSNYLYMPQQFSNESMSDNRPGSDFDGYNGAFSRESSSNNHDRRLQISPTNRRNTKPHLGRHKFQYLVNNDAPGHVRLPSLSSTSQPGSRSFDDRGNFILNFFFGKRPSDENKRHSVNDRNDMKDSNASSNQGHASVEHVPLTVKGTSAPNETVADTTPESLRCRANSGTSRRGRVRMKKQNKLQRQRQRKRTRPRCRRKKHCVPLHLRTAHERAAGITERFRGLLRAEVEKVILFANSRLGELSDTIGSLRFASFEDDQEELKRKYPNLADSGMHPASSSDEDEGYDLTSCCSSSSDGNSRKHSGDDLGSQGRFSSRGRAFHSDSSNEKEATTRRQIVLRDRLRISRHLFQKADFLGEDFSLLSAVDEADAYTAIGVELIHLLKFVCVNIIAVRKICKKHDRLLANRMLGDYYHRQIKKKSQKEHSNAKKAQLKHGSIIWNEPQFGGALSNHSLQDTGGYTVGIFDKKIQHIANSTTMQTVSSSLAIALADFESSQALSSRLGRLDDIAENGNKAPKFSRNSDIDHKQVPSPHHDTFTPSRLREVVSKQISGNCFRVDDDSTVSQELGGVENSSIASNISVSRLQFVVTSVFGLREAARIKSTVYDHYASRLFMTSIGPNTLGDGLDGCSRETLNFLCSYNPDFAYSVDSETIDSCLKIGRDKHDGIGGVMVASLAAGARGKSDGSNIDRFRSRVSAAMSIKPQATGEECTGAPARSMEFKNVLRLNAMSMLLFMGNYYVVMPSAHIFAITLGARSSLSPTLIGATNISSILSCLIQVLYISKRNSFVKQHTEVADYRLPLIISALCPLVGNIIYSYALAYPSVVIALIGRLLIGFGCAEIVNRRLLLVTLPPESINIEVARLVKKCFIFPAMSLFVGALFDIHVKDKVTEFSSLISGGNSGIQVPTLSNISYPTTLNRDPLISNATLSTGTNSAALRPASQPFLPPLPLNQFTQGMPFGEHSLISLEYVGYFMSFLWFMQLLGLIFFYDTPKATQNTVDFETPTNSSRLRDRIDHDEDFDSDSVASNFVSHSGSNYDSSIAFRSPENNPFMSGGNATHDIGDHGDGTFEKLQTMSRSTVKHKTHHYSHWESIVSVRRLIFSNIAFPTCISLLFLAKCTGEVLLSSCAPVTSRYFGWSGAWAGVFMGAMSSLILPINVSLSQEKNYSERCAIKTALAVARYGLFLMMNYEAIFFVIYDNIKGLKKWEIFTAYDDVVGVPQYMTSFGIVFISIVYLESSTLSLMSKVAPVRLRQYSIDTVFIVVVVSAFGRLAGDMLVSTLDLSSWIFCSDIINSLSFLLVIAFCAGSYFVKKHFFFLI